MTIINAKHWILKTTEDSFTYQSSTPKFQLKSLQYDLSNPDLLLLGEFLIETIYLSNDPAQNDWFTSNPSSIGSAAPSLGIGKILKSHSEKYKEGEYILSAVGWTTHNVLSEKEVLLFKVDATKVVEVSKYLSVFGLTSFTAFLAAYKYSNLDPEDSREKTFLVTGAAGAVGNVLVQLLSRVFKARKILAVAGSDAKIKQVESLGPNIIGLNYKSESYKHDFSHALGDDKIDVFFDQIAGELLDHASHYLKDFGRIVQSGYTSGYVDKTKSGFNSYPIVVTKRLSIKGFFIGDDLDEFDAFSKKFAELIDDGQIDDKQIIETIVDGTGDNFDKVPELWYGLFTGQNVGKYITKVK